jgi:hypothetical protein
MEFLDISSLSASYRYVVKINLKFKRKKREFGSANSSQQKQGKCGPTLQNKGQSKDGPSQYNHSKMQTRKGNEKTKKDIGKGCELNKIPWHNTDECHSKQSLVAELKASESNTSSDSESDPDKGKWIIDAEPSAIVTTTKVHPSEPEELEEGEHLFHSQMWVKRSPLHFIIDSESQKNLISVEVVKRLNLSTTPHPQPYTIE